jgi:pseudoazurin
MVAGRAVAKACTLAWLMLLAGTPTQAAEHVVRLLTESDTGRFLFEPSLLFAAVGDTVRFVPDNRLHAVKSMAGMLPEGVRGWRGRMGEELVVPLERPGVYGVKCQAHYQVGMVALIVVGGRPPNGQTTRAVRHPPMPTDVFQRLFAEAACAEGSAYPEDCAD